MLTLAIAARKLYTKEDLRALFSGNSSNIARLLSKYTNVYKVGVSRVF